MSVLKKRLEMYLQVFAAVTSPKQLFKHNLLYSYYIIMMSRPDLNIAKLSLDCLLAYKTNSVIHFKENFQRMLTDKALREELLSFRVGKGKNSDVDLTLRSDSIPLIIHIVYGRFMSRPKTIGSKKGKESVQARRNAILQFLSNLPAEELQWFIYLIKADINHL